jgi:hypothetical protein
MLFQQGLVLVTRTLGTRSECRTSPGAGRRCCSAMVSADMTRPAGMVGAMDQPTTLRGIIKLPRVRRTTAGVTTIRKRSKDFGRVREFGELDEFAPPNESRRELFPIE